MVLVCSCSHQGIGEQQSQISPTYVTGNTMQELSDTVQIIVIRELTDILDSINIARDDEDPTRTSSTRYEIGQIYQVRVIEYLKGNGDATIDVIQVEGFLNQKEPRNPESIAKAKQQSESVPLNYGKRYLLFLSQLIGFPEQNYFIGPIQPWRFDITNPDQVIPESPWEYARSAFPPVALSQVREQIAHPELDIIHTPQSEIYPAPESPVITVTNESYPPPSEIP
jgi:hypothetical protein